MAGFSNTPFPNSGKYLIKEEQGGQDRYWSTKTTLDDLLFAQGQHVRNYADLSYLAKGLAYSKLGLSESEQLTPLMDFLDGFAGGGTETIDKNLVRWRIYGEPERRAMSYGDPQAALNLTEYGLNGLEFEIWVDVDWFKEHDLLAPVRNKRCQVMVTSDEGVPYEGGYLYTVKVLGDPEDAFDPDLLASSEYWIKMGSVQSHEVIGSMGSLQFGEGFSYMEFEVPLTTMGWEFTVEGEAHRQYGKLEISRCNNEGRPELNGTKITNYLEARANMQMDYEKELFLTYGTMAKNLIDKNTGRPITTSPGLFEYMECGQTVNYSPEVHGLDFITEQMEALWFDRVPTANREIVLYTGQAGLKLFSEWVNQKFGETAAGYDHSFVLSGSTPFDKRSNRKGFEFVAPQFTAYNLPTFGRVSIAHWPILDNTKINGVNYPGSFYPISSYEFIAFNIGLGEPPIKFLNRTDNRISTYIPGLWSPFGAVGTDNPVFKSGNPEIGDAYKFIHRESFGMVVMDPSTIVRFLPNVY
jgi:hypothetical protein